MKREKGMAPAELISEAIFSTTWLKFSRVVRI